MLAVSAAPLATSSFAAWWSALFAPPDLTATDRAFLAGEAAGFDGASEDLCDAPPEHLRAAWLDGYGAGRLAFVNW